MLPNLNFIKTLVNGLWFKIHRLAAGIESRINGVESKIHTPDYNAEEGEAGYIKNKPTLIGRPGEGQNAEVFNAYGSIGNSATGAFSHAEGRFCKASGLESHAEGDGCESKGFGSHAEGRDTMAVSDGSHAEGYLSVARGQNAHAEGLRTEAFGASQHVQGEYNVVDPSSSIFERSKYAHIVGNGTADNARSNAHTLDWEGNAWFAGTVEGTALILTSPGGKRFRITVDDAGTLQTTEVTE